MEKVINVGLASFGMSGLVFHAPIIDYLPQFNLKKVLERTKNLSKEKYKTEIVRTFENLINDDNIDLIIVNTPDNIHFEFAQKALKANKHVVVEKPFTVTVTEGEKLISIANQKGKILSVFQNRRWDGDFLTIKKIIKDKLLGRLVEFESSFHRYRNYIQDSWKEDPLFKTGTIFNLGSHMIDQALVLFGFPTSVWADIRKMRDGAKVDDYYNIHLGYKNIKVTLKGGYLVREPGPRYTLHGTLGSFLKHGLDPQEEALKIGEAIDSQDWGKEEEKYWGLLNTDINGVHVRKQIETIPGDYTVFYKNIYNTITKGEDLLVKPMEALNVIKIIEAAKYSSKIGEVVYFED